MRWLIVISSSAWAFQHALILGGGFGGTYTALHLKRLRPETKITVVDDQKKFTFLPLLYEYACGQVKENEVSVKFEDLFRGIDFVQGTVDEVDVKEKTAIVNGQKLTGDALVLALGRGAPVYPNGTMPFSRFEDAQRLRDLKFDKCTIVGAGFTGVELACHLKAARGIDVTLVHRSSTILPKATDQNRNAAQKALEKLGVTLILGEERNTSEDLMIWTAGSSKLAEPLQKLPSQYLRDGSLAVDGGLRLRSTSDVFALGDAAKLPGPSVEPSAQLALQEALVASRNIAAYFDKRPPRQFQYVPLGQLLGLGYDGAASLADVVHLDGPAAGLARRLIYALRMPSPAQRLTSLAGIATPPR